MVILSDILGALAFRIPALRSQAKRSMFAGGIACFSIGFLVYALIRNRVYTALPELMPHPAGPIQYVLSLNLLQTLIFLLAVYVPALVFFSNLISGKALGFSLARQEYRSHLSALLPLWGTVFLIAAPVQWLIPHFLIVGIVEISMGYLVRAILVSVYTVWTLKYLNNLTISQACVAFILSWITLPVLYLIYRVNLA